MAIYHQHVKILTRTKGHNMVAAIAYRRGIKLVDPKTGITFDYSYKKNVIHSELVIPENSPAWIKDLVALEKNDPTTAAQLFANSIELIEKRKDAQLAREIEIALPIELTKEQNLALCYDFISYFTTQGMVAEFNIHWDPGNPHAHILLSLRELIATGWGKKETTWNDREFINESRAILAEKQNHHLFIAGVEARVSHLSNDALRIDQEATVHIGNHNNISNQQARVRNKKINSANLKKIINNPSIILDRLATQQSTFEVKDLVKLLGTQLDSTKQPETTNLLESFNTTTEKINYSYSVNTLAKPQVASPINIQLIPTPSIEILPKSKPQQLIEQVLTEITNSESVFTERYLTQVLSKQITNSEQVAKVLLQIKDSNQLMSIGFGEDGRERYTTRSMFDLENKLQNLADELNSKTKHKIPGWLINQCIKKFNLKEDQAKAIKYLLKGKDISCMVGRAGTGKSYLLKTAFWAWEKFGFKVHGISLAGIAAQNLEQDSGIPSRSIESFDYAITNKKLILSNKDIIVMDEAGMTDSISMAKVIHSVKQAGAKLVLVGDHAQLQPIGPGAIFRALLELIGFTELTTIRRQKEAWQQEATRQFAASNTKTALEYYNQHGHIHLGTTKDATLELIVNHWYQSVQTSSLADNLILAYSNSDVEQLNQLAREKIIAQAKPLASYRVPTEYKVLNIAIGERIIFLENNWRYQVKNGQRGTIKNIELDEQNNVKAIYVQLDGEQNKIIAFDPVNYKKFNYGYAVTVHRSQGVTVKHCFVAAFGRWFKNLAYVAMTRHQQSAKLYASKEQYKTILDLTKGLSKANLKDSILDYPEAFAARRGIDPQAPNNIILLQQHITKKLKNIKQKLADTYQRIIDSTTYWNKIEHQNKIEQILKRRADAKLVANYIDAHCQVGKAWGEFKVSNNNSEYRQILNQAQILRNSLAAKIYSEHTKYTQAIEIYDISLENLKKQAKNHELRERVLCYIDKSKTSIILRDRLAEQIAADLTAYYPYLKNEDINIKQLLQQAKQHRDRKFLLNLPLTQRKAFKQVASYINLSKQAAALWSKQKKGSISPSLLQKALTFNQERDFLAYTIKQNLTLYQFALDYFEIGTSNNPINEARLQRLNKQALAFELKKTLQENLIKFKKNVGNLNLRKIIAKEIIATPKYYHAVKEANINLVLLQKYANHQEKIELLASLDPVEKFTYLTVTNYKYFKQEAYKLWSKIFAQKNQKLKVEQKMFDQAMHLNTKRNELAYLIEHSIINYHKFLLLAQIPIKDITKHAKAHEKHLILKVNAKPLNLIGQSINNKVNLVSDYAKIIIDFIIKYKAHEAKREARSINEVKYNYNLFEQLGTIAFFIKNNEALKEICENHGLGDQIYQIEKKYSRFKKIEKEVIKLHQELNSKYPIKDYIKIIEECNKLKILSFTTNITEKEKLKNLNNKSRKFAYIIQNTPTLQYQAKNLAIYENIKTQAFVYEQTKAISHAMAISKDTGLEY
jgi:ATP-dependent exoDNAse (exonuclease V) alpha subunit